MTPEVLRALLTRPIAFHPILAYIARGASAGLFLSQLLYWADKGDDQEGWVYKTAKEWHYETLMSRNELETARKRWGELGVLEERLKGVPATLHYRVNSGRLWALIQEAAQARLQDKANQFAGYNKLESRIEQPSLQDAAILYNTDTTTETTAETTTGRSVSTPAHAQLTAGTPPATMASGAQPDGNGTPAFAFFGRKPVSTKGSRAPERCVVGEGGYTWAQSIGWRAGMPELQGYVDSCLDWYGSNGAQKFDWAKAVQSWVRRGVQDGDDLKLASQARRGVGADDGGSTNTNARYGAANGQRQRQPGDNAVGASGGRTGYGYDANGNATNKATQLVATVEQLAQHQQERRNAWLVGEAGSDNS